MLEVQVLTECAHIFVVKIIGIIEQPQIGDKIKCQVCREETKVLKVGIPVKIEKDSNSIDPNQKSIFRKDKE